MTVLSQGLNGLFDLLLRPLAAAPAWAMLWISVLSAVWALLLFKATTPQARLQTARDRVLGHIYEMGLYQDHLGVLGRIQRDLAAANLRALLLTLPALLALTLPMLATLTQLEARFAHRPLRPGETTVFSVTLAPGAPEDPGELALRVPAGVTVEAGPVRDERGRAAAWRLRADRAGEHRLQVLLAGEPVTERRLDVGAGLRRLSERERPGPWHPLLHPGAEPLAGGALAETVLRLPARETNYLGVRLDWLVAFMLLSLPAGLAVKDLLRVSL